MNKINKLGNSNDKTLIATIKDNIKKKSKLVFCLSSLLMSTSALAGWEVTFIDKFDGTGVNWQNWTAQIDANYNNEVQCYTDDDSSVNKNFDVSDGTLKIIARKQQVNCTGLNNQARSWTSGRINGKDKREFLYGRIESRLRFHNLEGGTWPAFWMLENRIAESPKKNDNDTIHWPNPGAGEIDVWEWFSNNPATYITNFFNTGGASCGQEVRFAYPKGASDVLDWHNYAIEWDENNISFYMDDTLVTSHNVSNCPQYKEPMFVLLNVAMGGNLGGNIDANLSKATMEVDYLAHCTATNQNDAKQCNESTPVVFADDDIDGIANDIDQCANTPEGELVDSVGCPIDDTVQCPNDPTVNCLPSLEDADNDGITDDIDQCLNTPADEAVDNVGCTLVALDEDNDGISDDIDQCPNTAANEAVNTVGCLVDEDNIAPTVMLTIKQNNVAVSKIALNDGMVEITAVALDDNIDDSLSYSWLIGGAIPSPSITNERLSFDPATMIGGSSHKIEVTVTDNGLPAQSTSSSIQFSIAQNQVVTPGDNVIDEPEKSSGGALYNLLCLLLISVFIRVRQAKTALSKVASVNH
ncbi:glycoside hydrolase family 16 protein [Colwellia piezophila]|uniref:glycoside hydrolase family 16 protein n=1 Tax=Colwellia piezophila TaxID=211668 RepID=UPI00037DA30F|nr:glycoside hydrolase family 16 protein [Colwellia piezophila]